MIQICMIWQEKYISTLEVLGKIEDDILLFFFFLRGGGGGGGVGGGEIGLGISVKLSARQTIHKKCCLIFSEK